MRSPALAMAWELWGRNRAGITMLFGVLCAGFIPSMMLSAAKVEEILLLSVTVFMVQYLYLAAIFTYPESLFRHPSAGFSVRKLTLPVRTSALVAWHMLFGCVAVVILWLAMYLLIWLPAKIEPLWWLIPLLAVSFVWMQAICWSIPRSSLLQILAAGLVYPTLFYCFKQTAYWVEYSASSTFFLSSTALFARPNDFPLGARFLAIGIFSTCALAAGYFIAVVGVNRVRHGASRPTFWYPWLEHRIHARHSDQGSSSLPMVAQFRYELARRRIILFPLLAFACLMFVTLAAAPFPNATALLLVVFLIGLWFLMGAFCVGYGMGKPSFWGELGTNSWDATKPISSGMIALARIRAVGVISLLTWMLLFLALPCWLWFMEKCLGTPLSWNFPFPEPLSVTQLSAIVPIGPVLFLALVAITWGQMASGLFVSQTGRIWIVNSVALVSVGLAGAFFISCQQYSGDTATAGRLWTFWTFVCGVFTGVKFTGAAWALGTVIRRRLGTWKEMAPYLVFWCIGAVSLILALHFCIPVIWENTILKDQSPEPIPTMLTVLLAILALPLLRLTAAPLAVAMSRHR